MNLRHKRLESHVLGLTFELYSCYSLRQRCMAIFYLHFNLCILKVLAKDTGLATPVKCYTTELQTQSFDIYIFP